MRGRIFPAVLTALSLMLVSAEGSAQGTARSNTTKLFLGLDLNGSSIDSDDIDADSESGAGATVKIGYGFTRLFSLYLEGTAASIDAADETFTLSHGELGARFHFGGETAVFIPYLDLAFTQRALSVDDFTFEDDQGAPVTGDLEISGPAVSFGGGFLYFLNPKWALNFGLKITTGEFDTVKVNNLSVSGFEIDATTVRFNVGISWFPMTER